jgi:hypothetical protein
MALAWSRYEDHALVVDEAVSIGASYQRAMERLKAGVSVEPTRWIPARDLPDVFEMQEPKEGTRNCRNVELIRSSDRR